MIPPTPTPLPAGTPYFALPSDYTLWANTDHAIQVWSMVGAWGNVIQVVLLLFIVLIGMYIVWRFISQMTRSDSEE